METNIIRYIKEQIRFMELEDYRTGNTTREKKEIVAIIINPLSSNLIEDESFLESVVIGYINDIIRTRYYDGADNIIVRLRDELKEKLDSDECWGLLADIISQFVACDPLIKSRKKPPKTM